MSTQKYGHLTTLLLQRGILCYLLILFIIPVGCHDKYQQQTLQTNREINEIIFETMQEQYLWYDELLARRDLNFDAETEDFYHSLLSEKDGKNGNPYSQILPEEESFLGNSYPIFGMTYNTTSLIIEFIINDSPAQKAGIQRGDYITAINGIKVNPENISEILPSSPGETLFTLARWDETGTYKKELKIKISRQQMYDPPIYLDTIYSQTPIGNIGYLFFHNEFAKGPAGDTTQYINELRQVFARFHSQGIRHLILDLRDNGGGDLDVCQLMCTMLVPQEAMGKIFLNMRKNEKQENKGLLLDQDLIKTGARIDLKKLVVITSQTTASASELVIHCLKPYLKNKLTVVGKKTFGKNVGMISINDLDIPWTLIPIAFYCENALGDSSYSEGIEPDIFAVEDFSQKLYPLGDRREQLLKIALETIGAQE